MIKDFRYVHLKTDWSLPSTRANVTSGENIAVSMGKLAKWYNDFKPWVFANPTRNDLVPVTSKTFTGIIASTNNQAKGTFYFGKIVPTTFDTPWHIKYRVRVYVPNHLEYYQSAIVDYYGHRDDRNPEYHLVNSIRDTASRSAYYHTFYRAKEAGITGGYGHLLGESLYSATNQTNTDYKRTFEIDILATHGCAFTFFNNVMLYENVPGTGTTNYNALVNYNFSTVGFLPDTTTDTYDRTRLNEVPIAGSNGVKNRSLVAYNSVGKLESFTTSSGTGTSKSFYTTAKFITDPVIMYYAGTGDIASGSAIGSNCMYPEMSSVNMQYSANVTTSVGFAINKIVYLEIEFDSDGYWHPTANGFIQEGAFVSGKYYIHIGVASAVYMMSLGDQHPILYWDGTKFISRDDHDFAKSDHTHDVFTTTTKGFVPAPTSSNTGKYLKGDGTWDTPSNTDTKVTQAYSTTNNSYPLLATATAGITSTSSRGDTTAILNNRAYLNPSTGILSTGGIIVEQLTDKETRALRITSPSFNFGLHIGSGGANHGIYDFNKGTSGAWIIYSNDATNAKDYHLNGTASALGTAPDVKYNVGSTSQPVYFSNGIPVVCSNAFKNPNSLTLKYNTSTAWTYDGSVAKTVTIKAGTNTTVTGNTSGDITINTVDEKVKQDRLTTNAEYPILFAHSNAASADTSETSSVYKVGTVTINPNKGTISGKLYESYLQWGGNDGQLSAIDRLLVPEYSGNRTMFLPAESIKVEYSTNGGTTWSDYGMSDTDKQKIFSNYGGVSVKIGGPDPVLPATANYRTRVTISAFKGSQQVLYCDIDKIITNVTHYTATNATMVISGRTGNNVSADIDTWVTLGTTVYDSLDGWKTTNTAKFRIGNGGYYREIRYEFYAESYASNGPMSISSINNYGVTRWYSPSQMAINGHLYKYDLYQNATFPANLTVDGTIIAKANVNADALNTGALDMNNSNIIDVNSIQINVSDGTDGIQFYRSSTLCSTLWSNNGMLFYAPARTIGSAPEIKYTILHSGNTSFTRTLSTGTKIGTITINGTATDLYCQTNTNTDTKVNVVTRGTTKSYLLATTTTPTSTAQAVTSVAETGVYLDTTAGKLVATSFSGNGSALTNLNASNLASGTVPIDRIPTGTSSTTVALGNHTHNYAGSSSAGGAANEADTAKATVYEGGTGDGSVVTDIVWTTQVSSTGYKDLSINDGLQYHTRAGSTTKEGFSKVVIGNNTTLGEDNNKSGGIIIYGCTTTSTSIVPPAGGFTSNRTLTLPDASGTICLTSHTHNYAGSSSAGGAANSVANKLSVYYNTTKAYDYDGSAAKSLTIKAGSNVTVTGNSNGEITIASSYTNTDTKVTQAYSTTNSSYPLLMTATAGNTSTSSRGDTTSILNNRIYANPSSGIVYTGGMVVTQTSDTEARVVRLESPTFNLGLHIGAGGTNHGIYDFNKVSGSSTGDWIIYSNDTTNTKDYHLKGSAAAIGTAPGTLTSKGSATNPVYFSSGVPVACTYSLNKTVPSDAVFTDTKVTQNNSTTSAEYRVLLSHGANNTNETDIAYKSGNLTFNPSTRILTGGKYKATWTAYPNQFTQLDGDGLRVAHGDAGSWGKGISFYTNTDMSSADCVIGYCRSSSGAASSYAYFGNSSGDTWFQVADHGYARLYGDRLYISNNPDSVIAHLYGKDSSKTAFPLIGYNATNVWIGANASVGYHHAGGTYISAGYEATSDSDSTNVRNTILVSVPESVSPASSSGDNKDVYNWEVMHAGCNRYLGHCTEATATAAKTVTTSDGHFKRIRGSVISIVFDNAVNAACTLNIDGTGAYSVLVSNNTSISRTIISASEAAIFQVSDSYYIFLGCSTAGSHCTQTLTTASSYTYWRPLLVGNSSGQYISTNFASSKGVTYAFNSIRCKPSTGTVAASTFVSTSQALLFSGTYSSSQSVTVSVTSLFVLYSNVIAVIVTKSYGTINCVLPLAYIKAQGTSGLYEIGAATTTNTTYHLSAIYSNDNTLLITNGTMPSTNGIMSIKLIAM